MTDLTGIPAAELLGEIRTRLGDLTEAERGEVDALVRDRSTVEHPEPFGSLDEFLDWLDELAATGKFK